MVIARFGLVFGALALVNVLGCGSGGGAGDSEGSYPSSADPYGNGSGVVNNGGINDTIPSNNDPYATSSGAKVATVTPISGAEGGSSSAQGGSSSAQGGSVSAEGGTSAQGGTVSAQGGSNAQGGTVSAQGGSGSGTECTMLQQCCDSASSSIQSECNQAVQAANGNESTCQQILSADGASICPSVVQGAGGSSDAGQGGTSSSTGGTDSSTGGTASTGGGCAALQQCCNDSSSQLQSACNNALSAAMGSDSECTSILMEIMASYCPGG